MNTIKIFTFLCIIVIFTSCSPSPVMRVQSARISAFTSTNSNETIISSIDNSTLVNKTEWKSEGRSFTYKVKTKIDIKNIYEKYNINKISIYISWEVFKPQTNGKISLDRDALIEILYNKEFRQVKGYASYWLKTIAESNIGAIDNLINQL